MTALSSADLEHLRYYAIIVGVIVAMLGIGHLWNAVIHSEDQARDLLSLSHLRQKAASEASGGRILLSPLAGRALPAHTAEAIQAVRRARSGALFPANDWTVCEYYSVGELERAIGLEEAGFFPWDSFPDYWNCRKLLIALPTAAQHTLPIEDAWRIGVGMAFSFTDGDGARHPITVWFCWPREGGREL